MTEEQKEKFIKSVTMYLSENKITDLYRFAIDLDGKTPRFVFWDYEIAQPDLQKLIDNFDESKHTSFMLEQEKAKKIEEFNSLYHSSHLDVWGFTLKSSSLGLSLTSDRDSLLRWGNANDPHITFFTQESVKRVNITTKQMGILHNLLVEDRYFEIYRKKNILLSKIENATSKETLDSININEELKNATNRIIDIDNL